MYECSELVMRLAPVPAEAQLGLVPQWGSALARNPACTDETRSAIWATGPDVATTVELVEHANIELVQEIAARDTRSTVVETCHRLHWDGLNEAARANVARRATGQSAMEILGQVDAETRTAMLARLGSDVALAWLARSGVDILGDDATLIACLAAALPGLKSTKRGHRTRRSAIESLAHLRPATLATFVEHLPAGVLSPVAGVLTLHDAALQRRLVERIIAEDDLWAAMALGASPVANATTVADLITWAAASPVARTQLSSMLARSLYRVDGPVTGLDDESLARLVNRASGNSFRGPRRAQLMYLATVPGASETTALQALFGLHLDGSWPLSVVQGLVDGWPERFGHPAPERLLYGTRPRIPYLPQYETSEVIYQDAMPLDLPVREAYEYLKYPGGGRQVPGVAVTLAQELGPDAETWMLFLSMVDGFPGTVSDLVTVVAAVQA